MAYQFLSTILGSNANFTGLVGIGTTSPTNTLTVVSPDYTTVRSQNNWSSNYFTLSNTNGSYSASVFSIINDLAFATSNSATERMRLTNAGNLLIGTTTDAGYKLDVNASLQIAKFNGTSGSGGYITLQKQSSDIFYYGPSTAISGVGTNVDLWGVSGYGVSLYSNGSTLNNLTLTSSGNVLIGTNNNYSKITVSSGLSTRTGITLSDANTASLMLIAGASSPASISFDTYGLRFVGGSTVGTDNGTEFMRITPTGNVGIGTSSPGYKLTVDGGDIYFNSANATANYYLRLNHNNSYDGGVLWTRDVSTYDWQMANSASTGDFLMYSYGTGNVALTLKRANGNVLIGTTTDNGAKLQVSGTSSFAGDVALNGNRLYIGSIFGNTVLRPISTTNLQLFNANAGAGLFLDANGYVQIGQSNAVNWAYFSASGTTIYGTTTLSTLAGTGTRMVVADATGILSTQAVPTGTITGSGTTNYVSKWSSSSSLTNSLLYDNGTNVGIGTSSPGYKLDVNGTGAFSSNLSILNGSRIYFNNSSNTGSGNIYCPGGGSLSLQAYNQEMLALVEGDRVTISTATIERMRVTNAGNVLINTTTDAGYKLRVNGSTYIDGATGMYGQLYFTNYYSAGSPFDFIQSTYAGAGACGIKLTAYNPYNGTDSGLGLQVMDNGGNYVQPLFVSGRFNSVGIGTTSPTAKLTVVGAGTGVALIGDPGFAGSNYTAISLNNTLSQSSYNFLSAPNDVTLYINRPSGYAIRFREANGSDQMIIQSGGNVLIGTTSDPGYKLYVNGNVAIPSNNFFRYDGDTGIIGSATSISGGTSGQLGIRSTSDILFGTNGAYERMRIDSNGKVGINTTVLYHGANLSVANKIFFPHQSNSDIGGTIYGYYDTSYSGYNGGLKFQNFQFNGSSYVMSDAMTINGIGNVGIGETNPQAKLHIAAASLGSTQYNYSAAQNIFTYTGNSEVLEFGAFRTANGSDWTSDGFRMQAKVDSTWMGYMQFNGSGNNAGISFGTGASSASRQSISEKMRIADNGNVLIGTTTDAGYKLDVNGTGRFIGNTPIITDAYSGNYSLIQHNYNGVLKAYSGYNSGFALYGGESGVETRIQANGNYVMTATNAGNVGIGTTSPSAMLTLNGTTPYIRIERAGVDTWQIQNNYISTTNGFSINNISAGTTPLFISEGGLIGIGTTSPGYKLQVSGESMAILNPNSPSSLTGADAILYLGGNAVPAYIKAIPCDWYAQNYRLEIGTQASTTSQKTYLTFVTEGSERVRIASTGNVLIGTTTDAGYKLDVNGTGRFTSSVTASGGFEIPNGEFYRARRSSGSLLTDMIGIPSGTDDVRILTTGDFNVINGSLVNILTVKNGGNVGVGTINPSTKLEVYGGHGDTKARLFSTGNGSGIDASLDMWASEPGLSYAGSGIGNNVNGSPYYGRRNTSLPQSYIRFIDGDVMLYTGSTTASSNLIAKASGNVLIGTTTDAGYKLDVNGTGRFTSGANSVAFFDYYSWAINALKSDLSSGTSLAYLLGKANSNNNSATIIYNHSSDFSSSNYLGLGFYGNDNLLKVYASGNVQANTLAGSGTRMVVADSAGTLSTQAIPGGGSANGSWQENSTQTAPANNTGVGVKFSTLNFRTGVNVIPDSGGQPTLIQMAAAGRYDIQFSFQFENADNIAELVYVWLRKNGENTPDDIPDSNTIISVPAKHGSIPGKCVAAWNFFVEAAPGDFFQLAWATADATNVSMPYYAATGFCPATPSAILTVNQVD